MKDEIIALIKDFICPQWFTHKYQLIYSLFVGLLMGPFFSPVAILFYLLFELLFYGASDNYNLEVRLFCFLFNLIGVSFSMNWWKEKAKLLDLLIP